MTWQSGPPISVTSGRGTLNRGGLSGNNMANTTLRKGEIDKLFQVRMTGNGPYYAAASIIGGGGRAVAPDGAAAFSGQVFFHPEAGALGGLQRRMFSGPWVFDLDFGIQKRTKINERHSVEIRMESVNIFNHPSWFIGDQSVSAVNFGRIGSTFYSRRLIQFGLYYRF
jgi:hypothetical protein